MKSRLPIVLVVLCAVATVCVGRIGQARLRRQERPVVAALPALPFLETVAGMWLDLLGIESEIRPWTAEQANAAKKMTDLARVYLTGWLPGYADPEYFLRLLFQSDSRTNEGGFSYPPFDDLIERARQERSDRARLLGEKGSQVEQSGDDRLAALAVERRDRPTR